MTTIEDFERERPFLSGLAYRMLGSVADAEDVVQEVFLRWRSAGRPHLEQPRAWWARTCTRLCLDQLKSARRRREEYVGEWLPEPFVEASEPRPELDESLSMALLLTIERLGPAERAAFLLHDVFGYTFREVAEMLDLESAHCRQLAARARRRLRGQDRPSSADENTVRRLSGAFFSAVQSGNLEALQSVLSEDVVLRTDGGGKAVAVKVPLEGVDRVARFFHRIFKKGEMGSEVSFETRWFNGAPGVVVFEAGELASAFHFQIADQRIQGIFVQRNPDKLEVLRRTVDAPSPASS